MIRFLSFIWAFVAATAANAQDLVVTTGEHGAFTRIAVPIPDGGAWTLERSGERQYRLTTTPTNVGFDLSQVFDRIDKERLVDLQQDDSGVLVIDLACACRIDDFSFLGSYAVLDIREGAEPYEPTVASLAPEPSEPAQPRRDPIVLPTVSGFVARRLATEALAAELNSAAEGGVLRSEPQFRLSVANTPEPLADTDVQGDTKLRELAFAPDHCPPDASTVLAQWAGKEGFSETLARLRADVVLPQGDIDPKAQLQLARFYVAHGMGHEAVQVLYGEEGADVALVRALATVFMPFEPVPRAVFVGCDGLQIWDIFRAARDRDDSIAFVEGDLIIRQFQALPPPLQSLLAQPLLDYFQEYRHKRAFDLLSQHLRRTSPAENQDNNAIGDGLAFTADAAPVEQLLERAATMELTAELTEQEKGLLEAFRTEYRETVLEPDLWVATLRVQTVQARPQKALATWRAERGKFPSVSETALAEIVAYVTDAGDDISFLRVALALDESELQLLPESVHDRKMARAMELGF